MKIIKRDGRIDYDRQIIAVALDNANRDVT